MMREATEKARRRLEMVASGMGFKDIAAQEGVTRNACVASIRHAIIVAGHSATPGTVLPEGMEWNVRRDGTWWAYYKSRSKMATVEQAKWALSVVDNPYTPPTCETCGRTL